MFLVRRLLTFEEIVEDARSRAIAPVSPRAVSTKDTLAYLMFSSGTTGHPRSANFTLIDSIDTDPLQAVMVSQGNIISNFNKSVHGSGLGIDSVSLHLLHCLTRSTPTADRMCTTAWNTRPLHHDQNVFLFWPYFVLFLPIFYAHYLRHHLQS